MTTMEFQETQGSELPDYDTADTEDKPRRRQTASWKRLLDDPYTRRVVAGQLGIRREALTSVGPDLSAAEREANADLANMLGAVSAALRQG